ncbi:DNA-directed RNA polymerase III subunit Rpc5 [Cyathus striatus]|nr:DNA-directed RNA polymerase III subunit Rpc5 [Cyathus striatus]
MDTTSTDDEPIAVIPIHYSNVLSPHVHIHQFPLLNRPLIAPPSSVTDGKGISARIKPNVRKLEIHVPADTRPEVWSTEKAKLLGTARLEDDREKNQDTRGTAGQEEPKLTEIRLQSEEIRQRGSYFLGILRNGKLHLHPINETHQLRPTLTYLDLLSRKNKRSRNGGENDSDSDDGPPPDPDEPVMQLPAKKERKVAGDAKEVHVTTRRGDDKGVVAGQGALSAVRREMLHLIRVEEDEEWQSLEFCGSPEAEVSFERIFSQSDEKLQCSESTSSFLKKIDGL